MRRAAPPRGIALAVLVLAGCADRPPPLPTVTAVTPASGGVDQFVDVQIDGTGFGVRVFTDFDDPSQSGYSDTYQAAVGSISLTNVRRVSDTAITGTVPSGVPEGPNDVTVTDPWGRPVTLAQGYFGLPAGGPPTAVSITNAPANVPLLACQAATIQQLNAAGAPTISLTDTVVGLGVSPAGAFETFSDSGCAAAITSVTIPAGQTEVVIYLRSSVRGTANLAASSPGLTTDTDPFVFGPTALVLTGGPATIPVGVCLPAPGIQFELRNPAGAVSAVAASTTVTLNVSPATGLSFYDSEGCGGGAVTQLTLPPGSTGGAFFFRASVTGSYTVTLASTGFGGDSQVENIVIGTASTFAFTPIAPQARYTPFPIAIEAQDGFGNLVSGFTGSATLSGQGGASLSCVSNCANSTVTNPFLLGRWSGWVVAGPAAAAAAVRATSGTSVTGTSPPFQVLAPDAGLGVPAARLAVAPGAVDGTGDVVTLDARLSSDYDGGTAALQYSFDALGVTTNPPGTSPWTSWSSSPTSTGSGYSTGIHQPRVAVRQAANPSAIAFATATVVSSSTPCVVNTTSLVDDGATQCSEPPPNRWGSDGLLSITEAIRITNGTTGRAITTSAPVRILYSPSASRLTITGGTALSFATGTQLINAPYSFSASGVLVANAEITGVRTWNVTGGSLLVADSVAYDFAGFSAGAPLALNRILMLNCPAAAPCASALGPLGALAVRSSEFRDAPGGALQAAPATTGGACPATAVDVESSAFLRAGTAILSDCTSGSRVVHATFHGNAVGIDYAGGAQNALASSIFSSNAAATICGSATFTSKDHNLLFQNGSDGCAAGDANTLAGDPLYFLPEAGDLRVRPGSPARDSAPDAGLDVNGPGPDLFFGAGPDRGGRETP